MKLKIFFRRAIICVAASLCFVAAGAYLLFRASLPMQSGEITVAGLSNPVEVLRDHRGVPAIRAENRQDIALAIGFLHAQDRFFQMDLLRRAAAGELSELFGGRMLDFDKERRRHQFRKVAKQTWKMLTEREKKWLQAYSLGVNQGLDALKARPFEYFFLREKPVRWKPEDSLLVGFELFLELQDSTGKFDRTRGVMHEVLPKEVYRFFTENHSQWDAPLDGTELEVVPIPKAEHFSYLNADIADGETSPDEQPLTMQGSNQWAVAGSLTKEGCALLACDMHLRLSVPNIWYRATFHYRDGGEHPIEIHGATLPGTPLMIIGSNRHIAWGFTNAYLDTSDIATGFHFPIQKETEWINVKGSDPVALDIERTPWGPVLAESYFDTPAALLWVAHDPSSLNMRLADLETVRSVRGALEKAKEIKIPLLNFIVADRKGHIGWTLIGAIPERRGFDGQLPVQAEKDFQGWRGFMNPSDYPVVVDPPEGYIVTANNRTLGGAWKEMFGKSGFLNGIRAFQIGRRLKKRETLDEQTMLSIQLDDEAIFFYRWRDLLQNLLANVEFQDLRKKELLELVDAWDGRCLPNSSSYYWIRLFRNTVATKVLSRLLKPCFESWDRFQLYTLDFEEPLWMIVSQQPDYLASPAYGSWERELLAYVDHMMAHIPPGKLLSDQTWGKNNTHIINHPLSGALPLSDRMLNMPHHEVAGDVWVPRVSGSRLGASQRMVVSPGREEHAIFHCPTGQCGHPLSSHYSDGHRFWYEGVADPLLPGNKVSVLRMHP
ncbi:MAG: penicillin acylase family protein [Waddliaceae bacterium]